jgi:hypothetical protein
MHFEEDTIHYYGVQQSGFYQFVNGYQDTLGAISYALEGKLVSCFLNLNIVFHQNVKILLNVHKCPDFFKS